MFRVSQPMSRSTKEKKEKKEKKKRKKEKKDGAGIKVFAIW